MSGEIYMFWQQVHQLDQHFTLTINSWHSTFTDPIWQFFSDKIVWIPMYVAIVALLIWKLGWKNGLLVVAAAALTFGFCDQVSNIVKHAVARIRPLNDEFMIASGLHILETGGGYSFFSAHAANAFGLACSTFIGMKGCMEGKRSWLKVYGGWIFFWAAMVSVSRVFVGKHYLGDILVGVVIGGLAGTLFGWLSGYVSARTKKQAD